MKYEQKRGISEMQRNELVVQRMQLFLYTKYSKNNLKKIIIFGEEKNNSSKLV